MEATFAAAWKLPGPRTSDAEMAAYFHQHFSDEAIAHLQSTFRNLADLRYDRENAELPEALEEVEDDLGYYDDGVKRTLTDEQIDMFRQSEIRELRREQQRAPRQATRPRNVEGDSKDQATKLSDGASNGTSLCQGSDLPSAAQVSKKKKKRKGAAKPRHEPKPDLRKRTWDVVEPGLDTLDYD